jgi:hypothetical protein
VNLAKSCHSYKPATLLRQKCHQGVTGLGLNIPLRGAFCPDVKQTKNAIQEKRFPFLWFIFLASNGVFAVVLFIF